MATGPGFDEFQFQSTQAKNDPNFWRFAQMAPGYLDVLRAAFNDQALFSQPNVLNAWLQTTPYWQTTSAAKRNWDLLGYTDPAEQSKQWQYIANNTSNMAEKLGLGGIGGASSAIVNEAAWLAAQEGWDPERTQAYLASKWYMQFKAGTQTTDVRYMQGDIGNLMTTQFKLGFDYGVPISPNMAADNAFKIAMGWASEEGMAQGMRNWAKGFYAGNETIQSAIDDGFTVRDWASPYLQLASQELEINPNDIDFSEDKWNQILQFTDETGVRRPLSLNEATVKFRNDPVYGYDSTSGGQQKAAQLTSSLAQTFGALG